MNLPSESEILLAMKVVPIAKSGNRLEYTVPLDTPWLEHFKSLSEKPLRFASILVALTGTESQGEHQDDPSEIGERIIVYLTDVKNSTDGAVEILGVPQLGLRGTLCRYSTRDRHRGLANESSTPRIALGLAFSDSTKTIFTIGRACPDGFISFNEYQLSDVISNDCTPLIGFKYLSECNDACIASSTCNSMTHIRSQLGGDGDCYVCPNSGPQLALGGWTPNQETFNCVRLSSFSTPTQSSTEYPWLIVAIVIFFAFYIMISGVLVQKNGVASTPSKGYSRFKGGKLSNYSR